MSDNRLNAALGVLMAVNAAGRLKPHPQAPQAHVDSFEAHVLIRAMDIGDRYTDRDDHEVVMGWLNDAWILTVVIDQPATFDEDATEVNATAIANVMTPAVG